MVLVFCNAHGTREHNPTPFVKFNNGKYVSKSDSADLLNLVISINPLKRANLFLIKKCLDTVGGTVVGCRKLRLICLTT